MTGNENGRPGAGAAVETSHAGGAAVNAILPRPPGTAPGDELGRGDATLLLPTDGRSTARAVTRCAQDGSVTVHPFPNPHDANGAVRRGACGHRYRLRVRRALGKWTEAA